jgi:uncharacterized CHY-type Zn-finger protein
MIVQGIQVLGVEVDRRAGCAHWRGPGDIVAIQFACCGRFYACHECHEATAGHEASRWPRDFHDEQAILCGACGARLPIREYLGSPDACPRCGAAFNPGCVKHHHLYFE